MVIAGMVRICHRLIEDLKARAAVDHPISYFKLPAGTKNEANFKLSLVGNCLKWDHLYSPISALSAISSAPLIRRNFSKCHNVTMSQCHLIRRNFSQPSL